MPGGIFRDTLKTSLCALRVQAMQQVRFCHRQRSACGMPLHVFPTARRSRKMPPDTVLTLDARPKTQENPRRMCRVFLFMTVICREQIAERPGTARACHEKKYPAHPLQRCWSRPKAFLQEWDGLRRGHNLGRITPTPRPSMTSSCRRRSISIGAKSGFSGSNWTREP